MFVCLVRDSLSPAAPGVLEAVARACSPRVAPHGDDAVVCDARGLTRIIGAPAVIAEEMRRMAWERGIGVRVAIAGSQTAAWLLAHVRPGATIVPPGGEARALERLPLSALVSLPERRPKLQLRHTEAEPKGSASTSCRISDTLATLDRWGLATLGDLARLPRAEILTRLGPVGLRLHQAACGEDATPLVPEGEAPRFVARIELEWPVEELEPLSFVLARLCDGLSESLARADRGAVSLTTRLRLVTKTTHERTLTLPAPMRDAKTLRTLILLDLEANPAPAGIDVVEVECGVTPGRIVQGSLLAYAVPTPENLSTLIARLQALVGDTRVGAPVVVDTHNPRVSSIAPFALRTADCGPRTADCATRTSHCALRRLRVPAPAKVVVERGTPIEVSVHMSSRVAVTSAAGPWRTSGHWWSSDDATWDRDEWDVALANGVIYRLARNRQTDRWEVEGEID